MQYAMKSSISLLAVVVLAGCAMGTTSQKADSKSAMPMAMMGDKKMMEMCMSHISQMTPEMRQKHMEMMQRHHQMMEQKAKPRQPS